MENISKSENAEDDLEYFEMVKSDVRVSKPFMEEGYGSDEIVLKFDNGEELYVSENFLSYASPVFQAMFRQDFREKETREVALKDKSFEDFHEFLLCLHPGVQKPVDRNNMLKILALANEYQVESLLRGCKQKIEKTLLQVIQSAYKKNLSQQTIYGEAMTCLEILKAAEENGFDDIINFAVAVIANFGYKVFSGKGFKSNGVNIEKRLPVEEPVFKFSQALVKNDEPQTTSVCYKSLDTCLQQVRYGVSSFPPQQPARFITQPPQPYISEAAPVRLVGLDLTEEQLRSKCKTLYDSLSLDTKNKILCERIKKCDNNRFSL